MTSDHDLMTESGEIHWGDPDRLAAYAKQRIDKTLELIRTGTLTEAGLIRAIGELDKAGRLLRFAQAALRSRRRNGSCAERFELVFYDQAGVDRIRGSAPLHEEHS